VPAKPAAKTTGRREKGPGPQVSSPSSSWRRRRSTRAWALETAPPAIPSSATGTPAACGPDARRRPGPGRRRRPPAGPGAATSEGAAAYTRRRSGPRRPRPRLAQVFEQAGRGGQPARARRRPGAAAGWLPWASLECTRRPRPAVGNSRARQAPEPQSLSVQAAAAVRSRAGGRGRSYPCASHRPGGPASAGRRQRGPSWRALLTQGLTATACRSPPA